MPRFLVGCVLVASYFERLHLIWGTGSRLGKLLSTIQLVRIHFALEFSRSIWFKSTSIFSCLLNFSRHNEVWIDSIHPQDWKAMLLLSPTTSPSTILKLGVYIVILALLLTALISTAYIPLFCFVIKFVYFAACVVLYLGIVHGWLEIRWYWRRKEESYLWFQRKLSPWTWERRVNSGCDDMRWWTLYWGLVSYRVGVYLLTCI